MGLCESWGRWLDYTPSHPNFDVAETISCIYIVTALFLVASYTSNQLTLEDKMRHWLDRVSIMGQEIFFGRERVS